MVPLTSVSASIRRLEKELDCTLFDRISNRVSLNANGRKLQQSLCVAFTEIDNAIEEITMHSDENTEIRVLVRGMRRNITDTILRFKEKIFVLKNRLLLFGTKVQTMSVNTIPLEMKHIVVACIAYAAFSVG